MIIKYLIIGIIVIVVIIIVVVIIPSKKGEPKINLDNLLKGIYKFKLQIKNGNYIEFNDPFSGFLVYAGANSGKTKSIGKNLLKNYIQNHFAGFIYDYKDFDITKTAYNFTKKYNYPYKFYYISFEDMNRTYRTNPISPKVITDENLFIQLISDIYSAYKGESKKDEWYAGAVGMLQGISIRFYYEYPELCTVPHIAMFCCTAGKERIMEFLQGNQRSRMLASAYIDAEGSEKTQASYLSELTRNLSIIAFNKKIVYVLSGNDFEFNLLDPKDPKLVSISNSYRIESLIAPLIGAMLSVASRQFYLGNKIPFCFFLDEATTFKIQDFDTMISVLREYLCSFTILTQSASKIEKIYNKFDRASVESNLGNQFFGRTADVLALEVYQKVFGMHEIVKESISKGVNASGNSKSKTVSKQKDNFYDTNFFTQLEAGRFVGKGVKSNYKNFDLKFVMYDSSEEEALPIVKTVLPIDLETNYNKILMDINNL